MKYIVVLVLTVCCFSAASAQIWERITRNHRYTEVYPASGDSVWSINKRLYLSKNNGQTWAVSNPDSNARGVFKLTDGTYIMSAVGGVYTLEPGADDWMKIDTIIKQPTAFHYNPKSHSLFIANRNGIYTRQVDADQWERISQVADPIFIRTPDEHTIVFATKTECYRSTDDGENWSLILSTSKEFTGLLSDTKDDVMLLVNSYPGGTLLHTSNGGSTWDGLRTLSIGEAAMSALSMTSDGGLYLGGGLRDQNNLDSFKLAFVFRYNTSSRQWDLFTDGLPAGRIIAIGQNPAGNIFASTDSNGIYKTKLQHITVRRDEPLLECTLFPNPAHSRITIFAPNMALSEYSVTDAAGKIVLRGKISDDKTIDISSLSLGTYFLLVQANGTAAIRRFDLLK